MRAVLYTNDMEPITVINLPLKVHQFEFRDYRVAVFPNVSLKWDPDAIVSIEPLKFVTITIERLHWKDKIYPMFITENEELALLLKSEYLPGQMKDYQEEYRKGFVKGLLVAFGK